MACTRRLSFEIDNHKIVNDIDQNKRCQAVNIIGITESEDNLKSREVIIET